MSTLIQLVCNIVIQYYKCSIPNEYLPENLRWNTGKYAEHERKQGLILNEHRQRVARLPALTSSQLPSVQAEQQRTVDPAPASPTGTPRSQSPATLQSPFVARRRVIATDDSLLSSNSSGIRTPASTPSSSPTTTPPSSPRPRTNVTSTIAPPVSPRGATAQSGAPKLLPRPPVPGIALPVI